MTVYSYTHRILDVGRETPTSLIPLLACPTCGNNKTDLAVRIDGLLCTRCKTRFPLYPSGHATIPWLFRDPEAVRLEWRARLNAFLHANQAEHARLSEALSTQSSSESSADRIQRLLAAREAQRKQIVDLLAPLKLASRRTDSNLDRTRLLASKLPKRQGLLSRYSNIFRDWSWDNGENDSLFESVKRVVKGQPDFSAGKTLTLGAGAGRLAYDLHRYYDPTLSIAVDINPLPLFVASRVIHGETVPFYEFPTAPLNKASGAVLRNCVAPESLTADNARNFFFVVADGFDNPFKPRSFDTVLTPWLIDIIPQEFAECAQSVNRTLKVGGIWINTGSLAFCHRNEAWRYSEEEVLEILAANGFEVMAAERNTVPHLQSPASAYGRIERIFSFSARKIADAKAPERAPLLPNWILETDQPIPDLDEFVVASTNHLLHAQILAAIDGQRSVDQIAGLVVKRYGLQAVQATKYRATDPHYRL